MRSSRTGEESGYDLLEMAGRKRGFLMRGAQVDTERMARVLLDEFRGGKLGRFALRDGGGCGGVPDLWEHECAALGAGV